MERFFDVMSSGDVRCLLHITANEMSIVDAKVTFTDIQIFDDDSCILFYDNDSSELIIGSEYGLKTYQSDYDKDVFVFVYNDIEIEIEVM